MTGKRIIVLAVTAALLLAAGFAVYQMWGRETQFAGSSVKNADSYTLDFERMNGSDRHALALHAGDALEAQLEVTEGSLRIQILGPDGTEIYSGNGTAVTAFTLDIAKDGEYTVAVEAQRAKGSVHIRAFQRE